MGILNIQRQQLDKKLLSVKGVLKQMPDNISWIQLIRRSLGMSLIQLANLLGLSSPGLSGLEKREIEGSITLNSLRKVADKLECDLVYMFVPKKSLHSYIKKQAIKKAIHIVNSITETMDLENQGITNKEKEIKIKELAEEFIRNEDKGLWNEY